MRNYIFFYIMSSPSDKNEWIKTKSEERYSVLTLHGCKLKCSRCCYFTRIDLRPAPIVFFKCTFSYLLLICNNNFLQKKKTKTFISIEIGCENTQKKPFELVKQRSRGAKVFFFWFSCCSKYERDSSFDGDVLKLSLKNWMNCFLKTV